MDFGALPPEVNSAKMYAGPGAGSMVIAAAAWEAIADELYVAAASCAAVVSALTGEAWLSPASVAMAGAAAPYVSWLSLTAERAQQSARQAAAAAAAFDTAFATMVPPPVIAAHRALLTMLVATNVLGVNAPAIAAAEAHYGEMWAQDAAAMYGYAADSAAASTLVAFSVPDAVADPAGFAEQVVAVGQTVPSVLQQLASPGSACASTMSSSMSAMSSMSSMAKTLGSVGAAAAGEASEIALPVSLFAGLGGAPAVVAAESGRAVSLGTLSVPQSWTSTAVRSRQINGPSPSGVPLAIEGSGNPLSGLPIAGMAPRGETAASNTTQRAGVRPTVMPRPEFIG